MLRCVSPCPCSAESNHADRLMGYLTTRGGAMGQWVQLPYRRDTLTAECHVTRSGAPPFDTSFGGGSGDQVEREMVLAAGGFTFHVLPQVPVPNPPCHGSFPLLRSVASSRRFARPLARSRSHRRL